MTGLQLVAACFLATLPDRAQAQTVVTECTQANLQAAISGGGNVSFACDGVIVLTNTLEISSDTLLDATGHDVTISGNNVVRVFSVLTNVALNLATLKIAYGFARGENTTTNGGPGQGGGIYNAGGTVVASGCYFQTNRAVGGTGGFQYDGGAGFGGAIYNHRGALQFSNCTFSANQVLGTTANSGATGIGKYGDGVGGAIYNESGSLVAVATMFSQNSAPGADGFGGIGPTGSAWGGAVYSMGGSNLFTDCEFRSNVASTGKVWSGTKSGNVGGGAISIDTGMVTALSSRFISNRVIGTLEAFGFNPWPPTDGNGGAIFNNGGLKILDCEFTGNHSVGGYTEYPVSSAGNGGAIYNLSNAMILDSTFSQNSCQGGRVWSSSLTAIGGSGNGGAIYTQGHLAVTNCTLYANRAEGGSSPGYSDGGVAQGGGLCVRGGFANLQNVSLDANGAKGGQSLSGKPGASQGGAIFNSTDSVVTLRNTIVADSSPGGNIFGIVADGGHNISSDATPAFGAVGSKNNTDPILGPLGDYGGGQLTLPLLRGSPAIDTGDSSFCPSTDQRGISRPYGGACDIGAFESAPPYTVAGTIGGNADPRGITISIGNVSTNGDASGRYKLAGLSSGAFVLAPSGAETRFAGGNRTISLGPDMVNADLRAYRLNSLAAEGLTNRLLRIVYAGDPGLSYVMERSTNLVDWSPSTNTADTNGLVEMIESSQSFSVPQFFRVKKP